MCNGAKGQSCTDPYRRAPQLFVLSPLTLGILFTQAASETVVLMLNKPKEVMSTTSDPAGRRTIYQLLPKRWQQLRSVGRLDYMTEGLLLLTNNGSLKRSSHFPGIVFVHVLYGCVVSYTQTAHPPLHIPHCEKLMLFQHSRVL